jgi:SagB-type dehydrogenase family enzyme
MPTWSYAVFLCVITGVVYSIGCANTEDYAGAELPRETDDVPAVELYAGDKNGSTVFEVIAARRSVRSFTDTPLTENELMRLLWAGQGITEPGRGFRTVPSAGALYPITLYVCDSSGMGRYDPETETLAVLSESDVRDELKSAALGQSAVGDAPVVIVIVAKPAITAAKYGTRAERYCMLEAGHVAQNILLAASALDLGAVTVGAFDDHSIRSVLGLGDEFLPLYLIPVGHPE